MSKVSEIRYLGSKWNFGVAGLETAFSGKTCDQIFDSRIQSSENSENLLRRRGRASNLHYWTCRAGSRPGRSRARSGTAPCRIASAHYGTNDINSSLDASWVRWSVGGACLPVMDGWLTSPDRRRHPAISRPNMAPVACCPVTADRFNGGRTRRDRSFS